MQTFPSIEDVAMYMAFDGVFGTTCVRGVRGVEVEASEVTEGVFLGVCACDAILLTASGTALTSGGGNGDMETLLMDAVCGWYARIVWKDGKDTTCFAHHQQSTSIQVLILRLTILPLCVPMNCEVFSTAKNRFSGRDVPSCHR